MSSLQWLWRLLLQWRSPSQRAPCARGGKDQAGPRCLQSAPFGATRSLPSPPQWASVGVFHAFPFHGTHLRPLLRAPHPGSAYLSRWHQGLWPRAHHHPSFAVGVLVREGTNRKQFLPEIQPKLKHPSRVQEVQFSQPASRAGTVAKTKGNNVQAFRPKPTSHSLFHSQVSL